MCSMLGCVNPRLQRKICPSPILACTLYTVCSSRKNEKILSTIAHNDHTHNPIWKIFLTEIFFMPSTRNARKSMPLSWDSQKTTAVRITNSACMTHCLFVYGVTSIFKAPSRKAGMISSSNSFCPSYSPSPFVTDNRIKKPK